MTTVNYFTVRKKRIFWWFPSAFIFLNIFQVIHIHFWFDISFLILWLCFEVIASISGKYLQLQNLFKKLWIIHCRWNWNAPFVNSRNQQNPRKKCFFIEHSLRISRNLGISFSFGKADNFSQFNRKWRQIFILVYSQSAISLTFRNVPGVKYQIAIEKKTYSIRFLSYPVLSFLCCELKKRSFFYAKK